MRCLLLTLAACLAPLHPAAAAACPPVDPALTGLYTLQGEREVGSQLLLRPDGQFQYMLAYGAIDQAGSGCWSVDGIVLTLRVPGRRTVPHDASPLDRRFRGMYLIVEHDGSLRWNLPDFRARYERD